MMACSQSDVPPSPCPARAIVYVLLWRPVTCGQLMYQDSIAAEKNLTIMGVVKWPQSCWQDHRGHLMFFHQVTKGDYYHINVTQLLLSIAQSTGLISVKWVSKPLKNTVVTPEHNCLSTENYLCCLFSLTNNDNTIPQFEHNHPFFVTTTMPQHKCKRFFSILTNNDNNYSLFCLQSWPRMIAQICQTNTSTIIFNTNLTNYDNTMSPPTNTITLSCISHHLTNDVNTTP